MMEIDPKEYREFLLQILTVLKEAETHITAHRAFFEKVSQQVPELAFVLTEHFEVARAETDARYAPILERTSAESSPEQLDRVLKQLLAQWQPQGPAQ
jgi:hypothetical protein